MEKMIETIPTQFETQRLYVRAYQPDDAAMYYSMSLKNQAHLLRYETGNSIHTIHTLQDAERVIQAFRAAWQSRQSFFLGAFEKSSGDFVAQIYIGVVRWRTVRAGGDMVSLVSHHGGLTR
ncbi:MAG TPA: hypothetical protein VF326_11640 [Anaerolineaceae bacterium]